MLWYSSASQSVMMLFALCSPSVTVRHLGLGVTADNAYKGFFSLWGVMNLTAEGRRAQVGDDNADQKVISRGRYLMGCNDSTLR